jgi:hypothetical protein
MARRADLGAPAKEPETADRLSFEAADEPQPRGIKKSATCHALALYKLRAGGEANLVSPREHT